MEIEKGKKIYFASDFHFGIPDRASSLVREQSFIDWLNSVKHDAAAIYLMGDLFDFWFEYKTVVPKGFVRLLGKFAELVDSGTEIHLFRGNHDLWAFSYLQEEIGIILHRNPVICEFNGKVFFLAHGDGLGPGDHGYKFLKSVFEAPLNQWLFRWIHPDWGTRLALYFSRKSRYANIAREGRPDFPSGHEHERLFQFCQEFIHLHPDINFFVVGHRHTPFDIPVNPTSRCIILGDWITNFTYAVFDGEDIKLDSMK